MDLTSLQSAIAAISSDFAAQRAERQLRRSLDPRDFERLAAAGFLLTGVPASLGGIWQSADRSTRAVCGLLRTLAAGDASVALVSAMHPSVLSYWLTSPLIEPEHQEAWQRQAESVFQSAIEGALWGTITSEPASGGDITRTLATARRDDSLPPGTYLLSGAKHFGSGWGISRFMVTTAIPEGETTADWFYVETRGSAPGCSVIAAEWDGQGMTATQSHAVRFADHPAVRFAWPGGLLKISAAAGGAIGCYFTAVIVGVLDAALQVARAQLQPRKAKLRPFEQVEWARAESELWLIYQAYEGMLRAVETQADPRREVLQGKTAIAELAEAALLRMCRVVGGGTYSRRSPLGFWLEDVRALGFLRPPWPLAYDQLIGWL